MKKKKSLYIVVGRLHKRHRGALGTAGDALRSQKLKTHQSPVAVDAVCPRPLDSSSVR
jgi:hypothetical protein